MIEVEVKGINTKFALEVVGIYRTVWNFTFKIAEAPYYAIKSFDMSKYKILFLYTCVQKYLCPVCIVLSYVLTGVISIEIIRDSWSNSVMERRVWSSILWFDTYILFIYRELHTSITGQICCHKTDLVHVKGHDRIILLIFSQALHKAPWWWSLCDPKH